MKAAIFTIAVTVAITAAMSARAEDRKMLPEIVVGAPPPAVPAPASGPHQSSGSSASGGTHERCVDVSIGDDRSFGCLNEKLKRQVDKVNPVQNIPPIDAKSSDLKVGVVNMPGVQQQYGRNFGVSAVPYRPAAPVFALPTGHR
jgi:hypothetical protein